MFGILTAKQKNSSASTALPNNPRKSAIPSLIAADMNMLGNIITDGVLDIDGKIDGNVRAHTVNVRPNGKIRGDVIAEIVIVHGTIEGLIKAQSVTVYGDARIVGTVMHETITIEDGAYIDGKCKRTERLELSHDLPTVRLPQLEAPSGFVNDNDEPQSEAEIRVLETLRLIS